jgi:NADPH:quinone reductase
MHQAAALPLVALTAWEGLVDRAQVDAGQSVLVQGGAGGVGHLAVQIAKARGARVYATASASKLETIKRFGATQIDYRTTTASQYVAEHTQGRGFDIVYDTVGGSTLDEAFLAARTYGHVVSCAAFGVHNLAPSSLRAVTISGVFVLLPMLSGQGRAHHGEILRQVAALVDEGQIAPLIDPRHFRLDDARAAHDAVEDGSALGKIVIDLD